MSAAAEAKAEGGAQRASPRDRQPPTPITMKIEIIQGGGA
jgi:hypothetical protein